MPYRHFLTPIKKISIIISCFISGLYFTHSNAKTFDYLLPEYMKTLTQEQIKLGEKLIPLASRPLVAKELSTQYNTGLSQLIFRWENVWQKDQRLIEKAQYQYQKILARGKEILRDVNEPLEALNKLRSLINLEQGIDSYCRDNPSLQGLLLKKCGNCVAWSKLYAVLIDDLQLNQRFKGKMSFGVKLYSNHITPVVIYQKQSIDLVYAEKSSLFELDTNIYDLTLFHWSFLHYFDMRTYRGRHELILARMASVTNYWKNIFYQWQKSSVNRSFNKLDFGGFSIKYPSDAPQMKRIRFIKISLGTKSVKKIDHLSKHPYKQISPLDWQRFEEPYEKNILPNIAFLKSAMPERIYQKISHDSLASLTSHELSWLVEFTLDVTDPWSNNKLLSARVATPLDHQLQIENLPFFLSFRNQNNELISTYGPTNLEFKPRQIVFKNQRLYSEWLALGVTDRFIYLASTLYQQAKFLMQTQSYKNLLNYYANPYVLENLSLATVERMVKTVKRLSYILTQKYDIERETSTLLTSVVHEPRYKTSKILLLRDFIESSLSELASARMKFTAELNKNSERIITWINRLGPEYQRLFLALHLPETDRLSKGAYVKYPLFSQRSGFDALIKYLIPASKKAMTTKLSKERKLLLLSVSLQESKVSSTDEPIQQIEKKLNLKKLLEHDDIFKENSLLLKWDTIFTVLALQAGPTLYAEEKFRQEVISNILHKKNWGNFKNWFIHNQSSIENLAFLLTLPNNKNYGHKSLHISDARPLFLKFARPIFMPHAYQTLPKHLLRFMGDEYLSPIKSVTALIDDVKTYKLRNATASMQSNFEFRGWNHLSPWKNIFDVFYDGPDRTGTTISKSLNENFLLWEKFEHYRLQFNYHCARKEEYSYQLILFQQENGVTKNSFLDDTIFQLINYSPEDLEFEFVIECIN